MEWRKEGNTYILRDGQDDILRCEGKVAISFSYEKDDAGDRVILHNYGSPEVVTKWFNATVKSLISFGGIGEQMANELWLEEAKFDVEELNNVISSKSGGAGWFRKKMRRILSSVSIDAIDEFRYWLRQNNWHDVTHSNPRIIIWSRANDGSVIKIKNISRGKQYLVFNATAKRIFTQWRTNGEITW